MERWKQTYWAVWVSNLVTAIGMMSFLPFFPGHLRALGVTDPASIATWAGVIYGTAPLSAALTAPIWGALGDRIGRRLMVLRSMLAITVFVGAMAFARSPLELFILRFLQGVFSGFLAPSMTLVSIVAPLEHTGVRSSVDVIIRAHGGGNTGQAGACMQGIARALMRYDSDLSDKLREKHFLTRDARMKERKKPGLRGARRGTQFSKR